MRLIIFILDAVILIAMVMTIAYFYASGYERGQKDSVKKEKKTKNEGK